MAIDILHRRRGRRRAGLCAALALGLAGCAAFEGPQPNDAVHTLCYTRLETSAEQVRTLAKEACNGVPPAYLTQEMDLSACPMLVPERLYFRCGG
jgi:hypothetical protein